MRPNPVKTDRSSFRRPALVIGGLAAAVVLAGCAKNAPQDTFQPAGENARKIDDLQRPVFYVAGIVLAIVVAAVGSRPTASRCWRSSSRSSPR